jgi:hypothetical protein
MVNSLAAASASSPCGISRIPWSIKYPSRDMKRKILFGRMDPRKMEITVLFTALIRVDMAVNETYTGILTAAEGLTPRLRFNVFNCKLW